MAVLAVLFPLSEAVGVLEGLQAALLARQQSPLQQQLLGLLAVELKILVVLPWDRPSRRTGRICPMASA